nr:hypothetical protein [uncultured Draconibacterium sp.]
MKIKNIITKAFAKQMNWIFILLLSCFILSCNSSKKQNSNKEELAEDLHEVKQLEEYFVFSDQQKTEKQTL